jgi:hypothetical protein
VSQFVDVLSTLSDARDEWEPGALSKDYYPKLSVIPNRYVALFKEHGIFRFTIQVSSDNAVPKVHRIVFEWHGQWDKFNAEDFRE